MAVSFDPNKIVGALDSMGSTLDNAVAPDQAHPFPTPVDWNSMSTTDQEAAPSIPASAFTPPHPSPLPPPAPAPYTIPAANENDSVQGRVAGLISNNSDLMKLAAQSGVNYANKRGLVNSSIAAGASEAEVLKAATPIATADANIAAQKNLGREAQAASMEQLRQQLASSDNQQQRDIAAQMARLQAQFANATDLQKADIQAQMDRLTQAGQQALGLQGAQDTGAMTRLQAQLSASSSQQDKDLAASMARLQTDAQSQMDRLNSQLANANAQQQVAIKAQMDQLNAQTQAQLTAMAAQAGYDVTKLQVGSGLDIARDAAQAKNATDLAKVQGSIQSALQSQGNSEQIQRMGVDLANNLQVQSAQLGIDLQKISAAGDQDVRRLVEAANQERVTLQQSIAAQDRDRMATAMVNVLQIEAQMRSALLGNTNIPADERAAYEKSISALGDPLRAYINQLFGGATSPTPAPTTAVPVTPQITPVTTTAPETPPYIPPDVNSGLGNSLDFTQSVSNPTVVNPGLISNIGGLTLEQRRQLGVTLQ